MNHPDERGFAVLRAGIVRVIEFVEEHGYPPENWSDVESHEQVGSPSNRIGYMQVSIKEDRVPLVYSPSKDGSRVLVASYIDRKQVLGCMSHDAFKAMETTGELHANHILGRE